MASDYSSEENTQLQEFQHFLDGAIHGIRTPLRGIGTSAGLLSQTWNGRFDEEARGFMRSILDSVTTLNELTKALADYSMTIVHHRQAWQQLPVENAFQHALAALRPRIAETGANVYSSALPRLTADHEQLAVLFRCLLSNALEFRNPAVAPQIEVTATPSDDEWRFAMSDNGIGIAPRYHRQILEPFERLQSDRRGFGLGLAICRRIVAAHGGRLWVDSRDGEGTTVFFALPK